MDHPALTDYLKNLVMPPDGGIVLTFGEGSVPDESNAVHGIIFTRVPTEEKVSQAFNALKPGGFCFVISTDEDPTGFKSAVMLEDGGFDLRDAILVVDDPNDVHDRWEVIPKAGRREREAGCENLPPSRPGSDIRNDHPTVKPIGVMRWAMRDVGEKATVIDPFAGSGTTLLACMDEGLSGIGVEQDAHHVEIAKHRITFRAGQVSVPVVLDMDGITVEMRAEMGVLDLFLGDE